MDRPYFQKPVVTVSDPHSYVPYSELQDPDSSINDTQRSGKCAGCSVYTVLPSGNNAIALATGAKPIDNWDYLQSVDAAVTAIQPAYATIGITQKDVDAAEPNEVSVVAHPSGTDVLNPPSGGIATGLPIINYNNYTKVGGFEQDGAAKGITVLGGDLVLPTDGVYLAPVGWGGFRHSLNNATVSFILAVERDGFYYFSQRPTSSFQPNIGKIQNVAGGGQIVAQAGDKLSTWLASNLTGTVTLGNGNITATRLEDTTIY